MNAVEAALKLKDETGCKVIVVTMGPPPAEGMLREILARGADECILVSAREFGGSDTYATSQILAAAVNKNDAAPMFEIADYGICGDLFKVTPLLTEAVREAKAAK